jgi:hypothetical protein
MENYRYHVLSFIVQTSHDIVEQVYQLEKLLVMKTIFVIMMFTSYEGIPAGEQVFGEFFNTRSACEAKLMEFVQKMGGNVKRENQNLKVFMPEYAEYNAYEQCVKLVSK